MAWACPNCGRAFSRAGQSHMCGTGDRIRLLFGKPAAFVDLFETIEAAVGKIKGAELVYAEKYAIFRGLRYAGHAQFMRKALRLGAQLNAPPPADLFNKTKNYGARTIYFADVSTKADLKRALPFVMKAVKASLV